MPRFCIEWFIIQLCMLVTLWVYVTAGLLKSLTQGHPARLLSHHLGREPPFPSHLFLKRCLSLLYFWVLPFGKSHAVMDIHSCKPVKVAQRKLLACDCHFMVTSFPSETLWTPYHSSSLWISLWFGNISFSCIPAKNMRENIKARILYNKWTSHNDPSGCVYFFVFFFLTMFRHDVKYIL